MRCSKALLSCSFGLISVLRLGAGAITPVPLPNPQVPGFHFPESEATIVGWVRQSEGDSPDAGAATANIYNHGWGLWTAVNMPTSQVVTGQKLRVFETWFTPQELATRPVAGSAVPQSIPTRARSPLLHFNQFQHGSAVREQVAAMGTAGTDKVFGYVKFDPTATDHIMKQQLLSLSSLNQLMQSGAQEIMAFPSTTVSLKSAFQVASAQTLVQGRYYRLNVWTGPPDTPQAYPPTQWPGVVWIDMKNAGSGSGEVDMQASVDGSSRTDATTYPVSSMINHRLSPVEAQQFNQEQAGAGAAAGDYAVLVAMHVAGREISRWTWQTFWWTPTPDNPQFPSSAAIAGMRPAQLTGPARNYAMSIGYDMISSGQPNVGGANTGNVMYVYNPYLEARFAPSNLPDSQMGTGPDGQPALNNVGVNCNCMSCHARANYNPNNLATAPKYTGARYSDVEDPAFAGTLKVDLLWSLPEIAQ
jgi:hypothetical protein